MRPISLSLRLALVFAALGLFGPPAAAGDAAAAGEPSSTDLAAAPAFSLPAPDLARLAAADAAAGDAGAVLLLKQGHLSLDGEGRRTFRHRQIYRIASPAAVDSWAMDDLVWAPWYQERPEVRARVVDAAGEERWLDPATVGEVPFEERDGKVLSDRRLRKAPLPGVAVGSVVEVEWLRRDSEPFFPAGTLSHFNAGLRVPIRRARFTVEAPADLPLRFATPGLEGLEPRRQELDDGRVRWTFDLAEPPVVEEFEPLLPPGTPLWPMILVSTGESWAEVARVYGDLIDRQIAAAGPGAGPAAEDQPPATRQGRVDRLLAWLHRQVRYTGVEFGEAELVPRPPAETLERGYGDCKDKSALLVALLRQAGIPAHLALLRAGSTSDVEPDLPGLGFFDHAIVYVPAGEEGGELWIDPTAEFARAGELPEADQDRLALIVRPGVEDLVRTPAATSADNRLHELWEMEMAELGEGRVMETLQAQGAFERRHRSLFALVGREKTEELFRQQAEEGITHWSMSDPHDLSGPFRLEIGLSGHDAAVTDLAQAEVRLSVDSLVEALPEPFRAAEDPGLAERRHDLVLPVPFQAEISFRIVPPPGFRLVEMPAAREHEAGPARLVEEFSQDEEGVVSAVLRFDSGPRRLSPAEAAALRDGVQSLLREGERKVRFEHAGEAQLAAGQMREALATFRRLPAGALTRSRIARAALTAGLGEVARREAAAAVVEAPELWAVWQAQGLVLIHDPIGRPFSPGWDPEGAEAAFRKALALAPDSVHHRQNLIYLLEHDPDGRRYGRQARLDEAIAEYRHLRDEQGHHALDDNLLVTLFFSGRFAEARDLARQLAPLVHRRALLLAATAAGEGDDTALAEARSILDENLRRQALQTAAYFLLHARHYPPAAALLEAAAQGDANAALLLGQAGQVRKTRRHEESAADPAAAEALVRQLLAAVLLERKEALPSWAEGSDPEKQIAGFRTDMRTLRAMLEDLGGPETLLDLLLANATVRRDGEASSGLRLRVTWKLWALSEPLEEVLFVSPGGADGTGPGGELVALASSGDLSPLGAQALARLAAGDTAGARRWLDWAAVLCTAAPDLDDPLKRCPLTGLWRPGEEADEAAVRLIAAGLMATGGTAAGLEILERECPDAGEERRLPCEAALLVGFSAAERAEDLAPVARRLLAAYPRSEVALVGLASSLALTGRMDEAEQVARERLEESPEDLAALRLLATFTAARGDHDAARAFLQQIIDSGQATSLDHNNRAWYDLTAGRVDEASREQAEQAVLLSGQTNAAELHTMAAVYAEMGRLTEARDLLHQAIGAPDSPGIQHHDWFVFGRIAEHLGYLDEAAAAYRRVEPPENEVITLTTSTYSLAQKRLAAMRTPAAE